MSLSSNVQSNTKLTLPSAWAGALYGVLVPNESVKAWLEPDLDNDLRFKTSVLVLTNQRLLTRDAGATDWIWWDVSATQSLEHRDHAGLGVVELFDDGKRLALWHHTLGFAAAVSRLC